MTPQGKKCAEPAQKDKRCASRLGKPTRYFRARTAHHSGKGNCLWSRIRGSTAPRRMWLRVGMYPLAVLFRHGASTIATRSGIRLTGPWACEQAAG